MKVLHTITCTKYSKRMRVHIQHIRRLTRNRRLTYRGIERMFARGCAEYDADPSVCVTRVETAVYVR